MDFQSIPFGSNQKQFSSFQYSKKTARPKHACLYCYKQLSSKQNLKEHMNIHTGKKPYKCTEKDCGQEFRQGSQFSIHKKIHTSINSYFNIKRNSTELKLTELISKDDSINKPSYEALKESNNEVLITLPPIQSRNKIDI